MSVAGALVMLAIFAVALWAINKYVSPGPVKIGALIVVVIILILWIANLAGMTNVLGGRVGNG